MLVSESGIRTRADVERLEAAGVSAILVGESLMRQPDIGLAVERLLGMVPSRSLRGLTRQSSLETSPIDRPDDH